MNLKQKLDCFSLKKGKIMFGVGRLNLYLKHRKIRKIHKSHHAQNIDQYSNIDKIVKRYRNYGGLVSDYQHYKLFSLVQLLNRFKPTKILELGSGTTTATFANYVKSKDGITFVSVDESREWLNESRALADIAEDDSRFKLIHAARVVEKLGLKRYEAKYDLTLKDNFDFVLIDGPSLTIDGFSNKSTINTDIFKLIEFSSPQVIVVDIRVSTVKAIVERLNNYELYISDLIHELNSKGRVSDNIFGLKQGYRYFSYFLRK